MSNNLISKTSLVVEVKFDPSPPETEPKFKYIMQPGNHGWAVDLLGNITPPPPKRVIRFELPDGGETTIYGLRFAQLESEFPDDAHNQRWFNLCGLQVLVPMTDDYTYAVSCVLEHQVTQVNYQLGVEHKGKVYWDDPRIYSDGSI